MSIAKSGFGAAIFLAVALLFEPVQAQQTGRLSVPSLLEQGYQIKGMSYNIGVLVQRGSVVYICAWGADYNSNCTIVN
jgi:hypothetical protein